MTHYFTSPAPLDRIFLSQFGLSVKAEGAIGQFGTGLKYAIATILRGEGQITIQSAGVLYTFETRTHVARDQEFQVIVCHDGKAHFDLPFTLELGKNWKSWMAFRELLSNSWDEGGDYMKKQPQAKTVIAVNWTKFDKIDFNQWFCPNLRGFDILAEDDDVILAISPNKIQRGMIYYRGMFVAEALHSSFTYYLKSDRCKPILSEDRTLLYPHLVYGWVADALYKQKDSKASIEWWRRTIKHESAEAMHLPTPPLEMMPDFVQAYRQERLVGKKVQDLVRAFQKRQPPEPVLPTKSQQRTIEFCQAICRKGGLNIDNFNVVVVKVYDHRILGIATNNKIHITTEAFKKGTRTVLKAMLEEYCHLRYGCSDETYAMQHALHNMWITTFCELTGEVV